MPVLPALSARIDAAIAETQDASAKQEHKQSRGHLGASIIGRECLREIWYSWRGVTDVQFDGRILRLFNRGHEEEHRMVRWITRIGGKVQTLDPQTGQQLRFTGYKGHFAGSADGIITGLQGLEHLGLTTDSRLLAEFKTHGLKSYDILEAQGVQVAKPEHYAQTQIYTYELDCDAGIYIGVCKNTDRLHIELLPKDVAAYSTASNRARYIVDHAGIPPRVAHASASSFKCKFCDHRLPCHFGVPFVKSCRTCSFVSPVDGGRWLCNNYAKLIPPDAVQAGCVNWKQISNG